MQCKDEGKFTNQAIEDFIGELEEKRIKLWADGESLRYKAPSGAVTKELLKNLGNRKAEILEYLKIRAGNGIFSAPIRKVEAKEYYPLSAAQMRMFLLNRLDCNSTAYNLTQALKINGTIDKDRLYTVLRRLSSRHEMLRTSFEMVDGKPVQRVHDDVDFYVDYQEVEDTDENISGIIKDFIKPYDLSKAPLFRFKLLKLDSCGGRQSYILIQDMHHIISDGVSEALLVQEVNGLFSGKCLPDPGIQYKDYVNWHEQLLNSNEIKRQKQYWMDKMKPEIPLLNLPTDYSRPKTFSFEGSSVKFRIGRSMTDGLHNLARRNRVTLYTLLLAAYAILLERHTGQDDILIGTPTAGRRHADVQNMIGVFINTLALRIFYTPAISFDEFLRSLGKDVLQAFDNQDYPFANLVEDIVVQRDMSRNPVFDTMFILQNMNVDEIKVDGLEISRYEFDKGMAQLDITLIAIEMKDEIEIEFNYCTSLFSEETISRFGSHFINILGYLTQHPGAKLQEIEMLADEEKRQLLYGFNNTAVPYPKDRLVHELIEEQVRKAPGAVALIFGDKQLTYGELNSRANLIAKKLREKGVGRNNIVGIMVNRSFDMLAGILGIMKSGGAYLPIDPGYPEARINYMIEDSEAHVLLTMSHLRNKCGFEGETLLLDEIGYTDSSEDNPEIVNEPDDLSYMIYTSGSTGTPKGVMISHRALNNFITGMTYKIDFRRGKSILALTTICFDIFALETHLPLTCGMKVIIADENQQIDSMLLSELISKHGIDMLQMTPSRMKLLLSNKNSAECLKKVTDIILGGEAFPENMLLEISGITGARVFNAYGPTETTVWSALKELSGLNIVNIGRPIANTQIYILGKANRLQPVNVTGELCIGGDGLSRGYWKRDELTNEKFIINPYTNGLIYKTGDLASWTADGEIKLAGRIDHQVKIRGYRVELEEIEKRLMGFGDISDCAITARDDSLGNKYIAAYYISGKEQNIGQMRAYLSETLPEYMIPGTYTRLEQLPETANGKIDRKLLPEPALVRQSLGNEFVESKTRSEKVLEDIWKSLLNADKIGIHDNFFDAGGNSLLLVQMQAKIEEKYPGKISAAKIFAYPTISKLAGFLDEEDISFMNKQQVILPDTPDTKERNTCSKESVKDIAIIGMHGVFAEAENLEEYWEVLKTGKDCIREIPAGRKADLDDILASAGGANRNSGYVRCGYMEEIDKFDYGFFNISPKEAKFMDPNQRLFLQTAWKAVEDSGYGGDLLRGSKTGVFIGYSSDFGKEYKDFIQLTEEDPASQLVPGNIKSIIAGRIAYLMDLKGPGIMVDTACSSALASVHLACNAIRNNECTMAIAGSVKINLTPFYNDNESRIGIKSPIGKARVFDDDSDGTGFGEGVAAVLLKPLERAVSDGDHIYAVIKGSAMNQDGASIGLTAPNSAAQEELILQAWNNAGIDPLTISYIEANGTGTKLGDSIEIEAISGAFRKYTNRKQFCAIGSVKTNLGHLDHAAGMARLVKAVLSLKNGVIPPTLHFENPNGMIDFAASPVYISDKLEEWETAGFPKRCGVSAFGLSGTNCHIVLEEPPTRMSTLENEAHPKFNIITMSSKSKAVLKEIVKQYHRLLQKDIDIDPDEVCYTANTGRGHYNFRLALVFKGLDDLSEKIDRLLNSDMDLFENDGNSSIHVGEFKMISEQRLTGKKGEMTEEEGRKLKLAASTLIERIRCDSDNESLWDALCDLYVKGADIDWKRLYTGKDIKKVSLPTYPFDRKRCWIEPVLHEKEYLNNRVNHAESHSRVLNVRLEGRNEGCYTETEKKIGSIWGELLGLEVIDIRDDFYLLGGNSLIALKFETEMEKNHLEINYTLINDKPTIIELAEYIDKKNDMQHGPGIRQTISGSPASSGIRASSGSPALNSIPAAINADNTVYNGKEIILENIEPFNDIIYKGCFYSAYLPVVKLFKQPVLAVFANEISSYAIRDDGKTRILDVEYSSQIPFYALAENMGIVTHSMHKSDNIINDTITALENNRPVIACVDLYHVSIRADMYNKFHDPHCLLIYGFDEKEKLFHILEHRHSGSLVYEKRSLSYNDLDASYAGYIDHFEKLDIIRSNLYNLVIAESGEAPSIFEFELTNPNNVYTDSVILEMFSKNFISQEKKIQDGLESLNAFIPELTKVLFDEQKLKNNAENIISLLSSIILSKETDYYRNFRLLGHRPELHGELYESLENWNFIRAKIGKFHYTSKYKKENMEECILKIRLIYQLEKSYNDKLHTLLI